MNINFFVSIFSLALALQAAASESIFDLLDHHKIPSGVHLGPVLTDTVGTDPYNADCEVRAIRVPFYSPDDKEVVDSDFGFLVPKTNHKVPVILILPNTFGMTAVEGDIAGGLCRSGYAVVFPDGNRGVPDNLDEMNKMNRAEILLFRTLIDYLQTVKEVNKDQVGLVGISYGGIVSGFLMGVEPRIKAAVLAGAGANIAEIVTASDNEIVEAFRNKIMHQMHLRTIEEFLEAMTKAVTIDSISPEFHLSTKKDMVLQYIIKKDTTVPTANQEMLWKLLGEPERKELSGIGFGPPHTPALVKFVTGHLDEVADFFNRKF